MQLCEQQIGLVFPCFEYTCIQKGKYKYFKSIFEGTRVLKHDFLNYLANQILIDVIVCVNVLYITLRKKTLMDIF